MAPTTPLVAQVGECGHGLLGGLPPVVVGIVQVDDVEAVQSGALQRVLDGAEHAVPAEVPLPKPHQAAQYLIRHGVRPVGKEQLRQVGG